MDILRRLGLELRFVTGILDRRGSLHLIQQRVEKKDAAFHKLN